MKHVLILAAMTFGLAGLTAATPAAAASRNFDCSKPGNANKAVCKPASHAAGPAAKAKVANKAATKPAAPMAKPVVVASKTTVAAKNGRTYDCSKAGNKGKAQCKTATTTAVIAKPVAKPAAKPAATTSAARTYDCAKAGNANKQQCKSKVASIIPTRPAAARPAAARPTAARRPAAATATSDKGTAAGAIARCKDGMYSHAARRDGACSRHGGVGNWMKG